MTKVLIAGAGPTGLVLALWLHRLGVPFRIIDKRSGPGQASRAMAVQARTLEFYRQLGFADQAVTAGIKMEEVHIWEGRKQTAMLELGNFGEGLSPYPFVLSFPQDDHERLLGDQLRAVGIEIEWNTELMSFVDASDSVRTTLQKDGAQSSCEVAYLCGCDGAQSIVRQGAGLNFPGGTYEQLFYVADVEATGKATSGVNLCFGEKTFCVVLPVRHPGQQRLIGIVPEALRGHPDVTFDDIQPTVEQLVDIHIHSVHWFATYRVHHRVTDHFRAGHVFVAGDAGHLHSPAGGQGMNTGIGDAVNLSWKLAAVLNGEANPSLLDTYETERIAFAHSLVSTTDKIFQGVVGHGLGHEFIRTVVIPHFFPFILGFATMRKIEFQLISQTRINYRDSALSNGVAGDIHGGDRLPWVPLDSGDNFAPLAAVEWQGHVYGQANQPLRDAMQQTGIALHEFAWSDLARDAGLQRNAHYFVRPDGYIAYADPHQEVERVARFVTAFGIRSKGTQLSGRSTTLPPQNR